MSEDYTKIKINPIFNPIKKIFDFYLLGIGFVGMPSFQKEFLKTNPGIKPLINDFNKTVNLQFDGTHVRLESKLYYANIGRLMAISIFDFLQFSKYNNQLCNEEIYRFAKHIRNGSAHNNRFNFYKDDFIEKPAKWKNKTIEFLLKGKEVIPKFINPIELIFLMSDISKLIDIKK
ncbi:MAG: hypothetical protein WDA13_00965 [Candidatus Shapirobacteria bacterium]